MSCLASEWEFQSEFRSCIVSALRVCDFAAPVILSHVGRCSILVSWRDGRKDREMEEGKDGWRWEIQAEGEEAKVKKGELLCAGLPFCKLCIVEIVRVYAFWVICELSSCKITRRGRETLREKKVVKICLREERA